MKLWGTNFKGKNFPVSGNHFLWFSFQKKQLFCIAETYFLTNVSFWVVETDFLAGANHFLHIFFQRLLPGKAFFLSNGKVFLNKSLIPAIGEEFFFRNEDRYVTWKFFSTCGNRQCYERKPILKITFSWWWKPIFFLMETTFFHCLVYFSRSPSSQLVKTHFSVQKNSIFFIQSFPSW